MTAYIGHALCDYDHKAGDSSGKEVKVSNFTYSSKSSSVYNWTYVFRPKKNANKMATMCEKACANNCIGYNSNGTKAYGKHAMQYLAPKVNYDLSKITIKSGLSCGDLISLCSRYAGLSTFYIGSAKQLAEELKKNGNYTCYKYRSGIILKRGDVLITAHSNGKNNHVVMYLGATYSGTFPTLPKRGYFQNKDEGVNVQRLQGFLNWAVGSTLTKDGVVGPLTIKAVKKFQETYGLTVDGKFGKASLTKAKAIKK